MTLVDSELPEAWSRNAHLSTALRYRLFEGKACIEPLRILKEQSLVWRGWHISLSVLGASHAVSFQNGSRTVTELLTCAANPGGQMGIIDCDIACRRNLSASVCGLSFNVRLWSRQAGNEPNRLARLPNEMEYVFLNRDFNNDSQKESRTRVGWQADADTFFIKTLHSYPQEQLYIYSATSIAIEFGPRSGD